MGLVTSYQSESIVSRIGIFIHDNSVAFEVDVAFDPVLLSVSLDMTHGAYIFGLEVV
jgi:hypothetical protein